MFPSLPSQQVLAWAGLTPADVRHYHGTPILCSGCGRLLHARCVDEANTTIGGHHLWFSNMRMRAFLQERELVGCGVAFCKDCHDELSEQILDNYKMMERFDEGARFLEEFGRIDEAFALLAEIKG